MYRPRTIAAASAAASLTLLLAACSSSSTSTESSAAPAASAPASAAASAEAGGAAPGEPITIGRIRGLIGRELAARQLEAGHTIFAQGSDAGLPHALGRDAEALRPGTAIVFDIFPREVGGYYHDMTRTFAIGHAPPMLQRAYDEVMGAYGLVIGELEVGAPTRVYQELVCRYFEERGHATVATTYPLEEGYVHSLGHGLGLEVHEDPRMSTLNDRGEVLAPGTVVTIEPGPMDPSALGSMISWLSGSSMCSRWRMRPSIWPCSSFAAW